MSLAGQAVKAAPDGNILVLLVFYATGLCITQDRHDAGRFSGAGDCVWHKPPPWNFFGPY